MSTNLPPPHRDYPSEAHKYLNLTWPYLQGNGLDLGSGGWPIVPRAIQVELPEDLFAHYTGGRTPAVPIQWHGGSVFDLPWRDSTCDYVHSSHLLEDFPRDKWRPLIAEWLRVVKPGGHVVIIVPDAARWAEAVRRGQPPNLNHAKPEPSVGEIGAIGRELGATILEDRLTDLSPTDYSILAVLRK